MPTTYKWIGGTSTAFATSTNFSPNGNPANGDTVIFDGDATADCAGSDQSAVTLAALHIRQTFTRSIGSTATPLKIGATLVFIGQNPDPSQSATGATRIVLDLAAAASNVTVYNTGQSNPDAGLENTRIKGSSASNVFTVISTTASLGIGTNLVADTASAAAITLAGGNVNIGSGVTWTLITAGESANVNIYGGGSGTTLEMDSNAAVRTDGNFGIDIINLFGGNLACLNRKSSGASIGTITQSGAGSIIDFAQDPGTLGITKYIEGAGTRKMFNAGQLVIGTLTESNGEFLQKTISLA